MRMNQWKIGDVKISRVVESEARWDGTMLLPNATAENIRKEADWLYPAFSDETGKIKLSVHSLLIESKDQRIIVDTCIGNDKVRPAFPEWNQMHLPFLEDLKKAGCARELITKVICTHLHVDHVGWNTRLEGRDWVPTFPNARYLICEPDFLFWDPVRTPRPPGDGNQNVFEDSVRPLQRADLIDLWAGQHRINSELVLQAEPGHTPGSSVLRLESSGVGALFVGDILHSPAQISNPDVNSCFCEDPAMARATRRRLLAEAADRSLLVFPGHFGGHSACRVDDDGGGAFIIRDWADLARV